MMLGRGSGYEVLLRHDMTSLVLVAVLGIASSGLISAGQANSIALSVSRERLAGDVRPPAGDLSKSVRDSRWLRGPRAQVCNLEVMRRIGPYC